MTLPVDGDAPLEGACHCGGVRFRVKLSEGLRSARRCTCSYCAMRGAVALSAALADIEIVADAALLATYQFNTGVARHHFCLRCGIHTHHQRRSNPHQYGVNAACLGISPFDFAEIPVLDGIHHPKDTGGDTQQVGVLRFMPAG